MTEVALSEPPMFVPAPDACVYVPLIVSDPLTSMIPWEVRLWATVSEALSKSASTAVGPTEVSVANALWPAASCTAEPVPSGDTTVVYATGALICEMSLGNIRTPLDTSQLPPLRFPFCSWTGLCASRSVPPAPTDTVPAAFESAGHVMELVSYTSISPGDGRLIDAADNVVPYRVMNPWLFSEVVIETFPDPKRSDPPSATCIEWTEIEDDEPSSPAPSAVAKVG